MSGTEFGKRISKKGVDGKTVLEWTIGKQGGKVWTGCMWLRIRTSDGLL
jgi:hypothetical protein